MSPLLKLGLKLAFQKAAVEAYAKHGVKPLPSEVSKPKVTGLAGIILMIGLAFTGYLEDTGKISPAMEAAITTVIKSEALADGIEEVID